MIGWGRWRYYFPRSPFELGSIRPKTATQSPFGFGYIYAVSFVFPDRSLPPPRPPSPPSPPSPPRCLCPVSRGRVPQPKRASWSAPDPPLPPHRRLPPLLKPSSVF